jgi:hypothetical protein
VNHGIIHQQNNLLLDEVFVRAHVPQGLVNEVLKQDRVESSFDDLRADQSILAYGSDETQRELLLLVFHLAYREVSSELSELAKSCVEGLADLSNSKEGLLNLSLDERGSVCPRLYLQLLSYGNINASCLFLPYSTLLAELESLSLRGVMRNCSGGCSSPITSLLLRLLELSAKVSI